MNVTLSAASNVECSLKTWTIHYAICIAYSAGNRGSQVIIGSAAGVGCRVWVKIDFFGIKEYCLVMPCIVLLLEQVFLFLMRDFLLNA